MRIINADELIATLEEKAQNGEHLDFRSIISIIEDTSTEDIQPEKTGGWIEKISPYIDDMWNYYFVCSECHYATPIGAYPISPDYCPGCGAKMEEEKNETD